MNKNSSPVRNKLANGSIVIVKPESAATLDLDSTVMYEVLSRKDINGVAHVIIRENKNVPALTLHPKHVKPLTAEDAHIRRVIVANEATVPQLRELAAAYEIDVPSKIKKADLLDLVMAHIDTLAPAHESVPEPVVSKSETPRVKTSHAECGHEATKSARAKCRRDRAEK